MCCWLPFFIFPYRIWREGLREFGLEITAERLTAERPFLKIPSTPL